MKFDKSSDVGQGIQLEAVPDNISTYIKPGDEVTAFCSNYKLDSSRLLTNEVMACTDFMGCLEYLSKAWTNFEMNNVEFTRQSKWIKQGSMYVIITKTADDALSHAVQQLDELSMIRLPNSTSLDDAYLLTAQKKRDCLKACIFAMSKACQAVDEASVYVTSRTKQIYREKSKKDTQIIIDCHNDTSLHWEVAQETLINTDKLEIHGPLSVSELLRLSAFMQETNIIPADTLFALLNCSSINGMSMDAKLRARQQIIHYLPVACVTNNKVAAFVNMHELVYASHNTFEKLLLLDQVDTHVSDGINAANQAPILTHLAAEKRGPMPKHLKVPGLVEETIKFIQLHGFSAQCRRRTTTGNMCGVTLEAIKQHLIGSFPKLKTDGISTTTIRYLMMAPNKHRRTSSKYKGLINARVPPKSNSARSSEHSDTHYCRAQVNLIMEAAFDHPDENLCISCDDKNNINVGTTVSAVSRYHHVDKIFMAADAVDHFDHSFPEPNSKIKPCGYMKLEYHQPVAIRQGQTPSRRAISQSAISTGSEGIMTFCVTNDDNNDDDDDDDIDDQSYIILDKLLGMYDAVSLYNNYLFYDFD